jgi:hypothetical protein
MVQRLVAVALSSCFLVAQDPRGIPKPKPTIEVSDQGEVKSSEAADGGAEDAKAAAAQGGVVGTPAEPVIGSRGYCRIEVAVRPGRLLPGQSGTAVVTMILEGDAVMVAPATVDVHAAAGGPLQFGTATLSPPERGRLAKFFRGQPVYDNWAVLHVPVTMSANVPLGSKQVAGLDLAFDLANGTTGQPIGRFAERATVSVEVGAVKDPQVRMPDLAPQQPPAAGEAADEPKRQEGDDGAVLAPSQGVSAMEPVALPSEPAPAKQQDSGSTDGSYEDAGPPAVDGGEGASGNLLLYLAGGALLMVLVLILKSRK